MVGIMNGIPDLSSLTTKLESFRRSDAAREELIESLVKSYEELNRNYREKCDDYENERQSRRMWQEQTENARRELVAARYNSASAPFALALIDGDGAMFLDILLKSGADGGSDAAHKLLTSIREHLQESYEGAAGWSVMVNLYANLEGLANKLRAIGVLKSKDDLYTFTRAFSLNQPLFNFIDVGVGKERADHKIKEMLRVFMPNQQCKHIIFGGCHDNGYLPNLDSYKHDPAIASRLTLLETTPVTFGFSELPFQRTRFPAVFRSTPLPEKPVTSLTSSAMPFVPASIVPSRPVAPPQPQYTPIPVAPPSMTIPTPPPVMSPSPPVSISSPAQNTWATVGKNGSTSSNYSIGTKKSRPRPAVYLNSMDQRIDPPLPSASREAQEHLHARIQKKKLCNAWHLSGKCEYEELGEQCPFSHAPALNEMERVALKAMARSRSCPKRNDCRDVNCYFGHHCPFGAHCNKQGCFFRELHNIDRTIVMKQYDDGHIDVVQPS